MGRTPHAAPPTLGCAEARIPRDFYRTPPNSDEPVLRSFLNTSPREHSPIHRQGCADDVGRLVRAYEHDGVGNLFGHSHALGRNVCLEEICLVFRRLRKAVKHPVSVGPGPTMLTRTPVPASSRAADRRDQIGIEPAVTRPATIRTSGFVLPWRDH